MAALALAEQELAEVQDQLDAINTSLAAEPKDPTELLAIKAELEAMIPLMEDNVAALKPTAAPAPLSQPSPPVEQPKWSKENHPAFKKTPTAPVEASPIAHQYRSGEKIMAQWKRQWSHATVVQIMGSTAKPKYYVKYDGYNNYETLEADQVKPIENRKRKAEELFTPPISKPGSSVISAAANIDTTLASQVKREPSKVSDGPTRPPKIPKKIQAKKKLEEHQNAWKNFSAKPPVKGAKKKESMFRTGDGVTARVGFTGSGQAMRKDAPRSRHVYQPTNDDDDN